MGNVLLVLSGVTRTNRGMAARGAVACSCEGILHVSWGWISVRNQIAGDGGFGVKVQSCMPRADIHVGEWLLLGSSGCLH